MMDREEQFRRNHESAKMRQGIPQEADVIFLPEHDPELKAANLELADALTAGGKKVSFVRVSLVAETMTVFVPEVELVESASDGTVNT